MFRTYPICTATPRTQPTLRTIVDRIEHELEREQRLFGRPASAAIIDHEQQHIPRRPPSAAIIDRLHPVR